MGESNRKNEKEDAVSVRVDTVVSCEFVGWKCPRCGRINKVEECKHNNTITDGTIWITGPTYWEFGKPKYRIVYS